MYSGLSTRYVYMKLYSLKENQTTLNLVVKQRPRFVLLVLFRKIQAAKI
uniref:Uncharacterized protein n=1 Tax=Anguilla anguilla TaxID=7936 RepID=A0A0E9XSJ0_ANGAN